MCRKQASKGIFSASKKAREANGSSLIGLLAEHSTSWFSDSIGKETQPSTLHAPGKENTAASGSTASRNRGEAESSSSSLIDGPGCSKLEESWPEDDDAAALDERWHCSEAEGSAMTHNRRNQRRTAGESRAGNAVRDRRKEQHAAHGIGTADRQQTARRAKKSRFLGQYLKQRQEPSKKVSSNLKHGDQIRKPSKAWKRYPVSDAFIFSRSKVLTPASNARVGNKRQAGL